MTISMTDTLQPLVDARCGGTGSEYGREPARKDQDRVRLRGLLVGGAATAPSTPVNCAYFEGLRNRVRARRSFYRVRTQNAGSNGL